MIGDFSSPRQMEKAALLSGYAKKAIDKALPNYDIEVEPVALSNGVGVRVRMYFTYDRFVDDKLPEKHFEEIAEGFARTVRHKLIDRLKRTEPTLGELDIYGSDMWQRCYEARLLKHGDSTGLGGDASITSKEWQR